MQPETKNFSRVLSSNKSRVVRFKPVLSSNVAIISGDAGAAAGAGAAAAVALHEHHRRGRMVCLLSNGTQVNGLSASTGYFLHEQFYPPVLLGDAHHTSF